MSITIESLNQEINKLAKLREDEANASRIKKEISEELEKVENIVMEMLVEAGLPNFTSPSGKVVLAYRTSVRTPKLPEHKEMFYAYLRERGLFDSMISVNSQTLNSLYKSELEAAKERGDADFSIPGLTEVSLTPQLRFSRA